MKKKKVVLKWQKICNVRDENGNSLLLLINFTEKKKWPEVEGVCVCSSCSLTCPSLASCRLPLSWLCFFLSQYPWSANSSPTSASVFGYNINFIFHFTLPNNSSPPFIQLIAWNILYKLGTSEFYTLKHRELSTTLKSKLESTEFERARRRPPGVGWQTFVCLQSRGRNRVHSRYREKIENVLQALFTPGSRCRLYRYTVFAGDRGVESSIIVK